MTEKDAAPTKRGTRRVRIADALKNHRPTPDQAERIVDARAKRRLGNAERYRKIEERSARVGLAQEDLAALVDCSQNEISKIVTGERQRIDPDLAERIGKELNMTRDEVMYGEPQSRRVKVLGKILGDEAVSIYNDEQDMEIDWLTDKEMEGYRIGVETLEPRFNKGEILLCRSKNTLLEECFGRECVVELEGRQRFIKHVERGASVRIVTLRSYRAVNPTVVDVTPKWISPIIAIIPAGARGLSESGI